MNSQTEGRPGPLAGVRVIDLTRILAGPLCTMQLGDLGAEIIKIEAPGGDDTRQWGPPFVDGESAYFLTFNRNKRSVVLDLSTADALAQLKELIRTSDVVVDNFKTGTLRRWGLDDGWFELNAPRVIRCSITGYGTSGPNAELPGYDFILQAESGLMSLCGEPDGRPMKFGIAVVDITTGLLAFNGIVAALYSRTQTGKGQKVEASLFESGLFLLANVAGNAIATGAPPKRYGNGHPNIVPYTTYQAQDGAIAVAVGNDRQFERLARLLEMPEVAAEPRFATNALRVANRDELDRVIGAAIAVRSADHWIGRLRAEGIPAGKINTVSEALGDPQCEAREMVLPMPLASGGSGRTLGFPVKFSATPAAISRPPPLLGAHTDEVLGSLRIQSASHV